MEWLSRRTFIIIIMAVQSNQFFIESIHTYRRQRSNYDVYVAKARGHNTRNDNEKPISNIVDGCTFVKRQKYQLSASRIMNIWSDEFGNNKNKNKTLLP